MGSGVRPGLHVPPPGPAAPWPGAPCPPPPSAVWTAALGPNRCPCPGTPGVSPGPWAHPVPMLQRPDTPAIRVKLEGQAWSREGRDCPKWDLGRGMCILPGGACKLGARGVSPRGFSQPCEPAVVPGRVWCERWAPPSPTWARVSHRPVAPTPQPRCGDSWLRRNPWRPRSACR